LAPAKAFRYGQAITERNRPEVEPDSVEARS